MAINVSICHLEEDAYLQFMAAKAKYAIMVLRVASLINDRGYLCGSFLS